MKNSTTSAALTTPMRPPTTLCHAPRSTNDRATVRTVSPIRMAKTVTYVVGGTTRSDMVASPQEMQVAHVVLTGQVQQRQQEDPHDIDEVPVQGQDLDRHVVQGREPAAPRQH